MSSAPGVESAARADGRAATGRPDVDAQLDGRAEPPAAKRLRDRLTADALLAAVRAMHPGVTASSLVSQWWDGTALVPALLVEVEGRKLRVVTGARGEVVLLPRWSWAARRRLRRNRRSGRPGATGRPQVAVTPGGLPRTPLLYEASAKRARSTKPARPGPRVPVRLVGAVDYRACSHVGCGAVVALPAAGPDPPCPRCGRR